MGKIMMGYVQWKEILSVVDKEEDLSKDNVIEKTEKALGSRLNKLASQLGGTHDQEYDALKEKLQSWRKSKFALDYKLDSDIGTLLHIAARNNCVNMVKSMKDKGVDINIQNERGNTSLHEAVESGHKEAVQSLIENGADVNAKTKVSGETPLHLARNAEIAELLIKSGASVNEKNKYGLVPLHNAVECKVDIIGWSIKKMFSTIARDTYKNTPLHNDDHIDVAKVLSQTKGININAANEDGYTPLHLAVTRGCTDTVKTLLQAEGINVNTADKNEYTPLHLAAVFGCVDVVQVLLQAEGINVNTADKNEYTPLHLAAVFGCVDVVQVLLQAEGINVNAADKNECTPLHLAVLFGHTDTVKALLQAKGIDVNATDKSGWTPLFIRLAAQHTIQYITNIATSIGINVDTESLSIFLDENSSEKIVDALMEKGANHLLKSKDGEIPMDLDKNGYIKQFLKQKALKKSIFYGGATALLGTAVAIALFATGTIAVELMPVVIAVAAIATAALAVGGVTYMMLKPSTKMDEVGEKKVAGDEQEVPPVA